MGPVLWALELVIDEVGQDLMPDYGIHVAADRVVWKTQLERVALKLRQAIAAKVHEQHVWVLLSLPAEEASACGHAMLVATNRLDHFVSMEGLRGDAVAEAAILPYDRTPWMVELVRKHFLTIAHDIAWVRQESLRLLLHAHCLLEHGNGDSES